MSGGGIAYARTPDGVFLAYQVIGDGPVDILISGSLWWNIEYQWTDPDVAGGFRQWSRLGRIITFDKRGTGLSDRVPTDQLPDLQTRTADLNAVLDAAKPGVVLEELAAAWSKVIARHGIEKDSRIGYPVGIGYPPTWGELTCSLRQGDRTVLEPNMTFHCIPAIWLDEYGLVISESFVVTETGAKTFADFPRKLFAR